MTRSDTALDRPGPAFHGVITIADPVDVAALPRFEDPVWQLRPQVRRRNASQSQATLDFRTIPHPDRRQLAKEFLALRLHPTLSRPDRPCSPTTAVAEFSLLRRFLTYLDDHHGGIRLRDVDQRILDGWQRFAAAGRPGRSPLGPSGVRRNVDIPIKLHRLAPQMVTDQLHHLPWEGRPARHVAGEPHSVENVTPRIPEAVIVPLLQAALAYIDVFAGDIFAARREWDQLRDRSVPPSTMPAHARLHAFVQRRREAGRGIPAVGETRNRRGPLPQDPLLTVNLTLTARLAGMRPIAFSDRSSQESWALRAALRVAVGELGLEPGGLETRPTTLTQTGAPWHEGFGPWIIESQERLVTAACLIVCLYLTGMRESEVASLRRGCAFEERTEDGVLPRYKLRGLTYKGRQATGDEATWVTIPEVHRAVATLERLSSDDWLIPDGRHSGSMRAASLTGLLLDDFRTYICANHSRLGLDPIPDVNGEPWVLTGRQFRRTIAWHIANRPYGVVAGSIQFQHLSTAMFEGYAGTSPSGFRAEVEAERAFARLDELVERFEEFCDGHRIGGPGSERLTAEFTTIREQLGPFSGRVASDRRIRQMLEHLASALHPGALNDCLYDRDHALCRPWAPDSGTKPVPVMCQPTTCPNSSLMPRHQPAWERVAADVDALLSRPQLPVVQQRMLTSQRDHVLDVLDSLRPNDG